MGCADFGNVRSTELTVWMVTLLANSLSAFDYLIKHVVGMGSFKQVRGPNAKWPVTGVKNVDLW
jgi:hypothetical protein